MADHSAVEDAGRLDPAADRLQRIDPTTDPRWRRIADRAAGSLFSSPNWLRVIRDTYGWSPSAIILTDPAGQAVAGVPYFELSDVRGERLVSVPFSDYCDPLVESDEQWRALSAPLLEGRRPFALRTLHRQEPLGDSRLATVKRARWHRLDLRPDLETLWSSLDGAARRAVRKAEREGLEIRVSRERGDLRAFFDMHLGIRKNKYRLLAQPYPFFERIWESFADHDRGWVILGGRGGRTIGGIMLLAWGRTLYYKFNASVPSELSRRTNDLLVWNTITWAKAMGFDSLDFGLSDWDQEGLIRYKRKFASEEGTITFLQSAGRTAPCPATPEAMRLLGALTTLMTDAAAPIDVTERAGDALYHLFA